MHPMFVTLFMETDADDLLTERAGQEAPRARGQARQSNPGRKGRRRPRSPAPPLTHEPSFRPSWPAPGYLARHYLTHSAITTGEIKVFSKLV